MPKSGTLLLTCLNCTYEYCILLTLAALSATEPAFITVPTKCVFMHGCAACGTYIIVVLLLYQLEYYA